MPHALHDPVVLAAVEDCLKVVAPHLDLSGCIDSINTALSSGCPVVGLACKRYSRQHLDSGEYANQRHTTHLCAGCGHKLDVSP